MPFEHIIFSTNLLFKMSHHKSPFFHGFFYITLFAQSTLTSEASFLTKPQPFQYLVVTSISYALGGISSASEWHIENDFTLSKCPVPFFYVNSTHISYAIGLDGYDYDLEKFSSNHTDPFPSNNEETLTSFGEDSCSSINLFAQDYYSKDESWKYMTFSDALQNEKNPLFEWEKADFHKLQAACLAKNRKLEAETLQNDKRIAALEKALSTKENQLKALRNTVSQKKDKKAKKKKDIYALEKQIERLEKKIISLQEDLFYRTLGMPVVSIITMIISGAYIYIQNDSIKMKKKQIEQLKKSSSRDDADFLHIS